MGGLYTKRPHCQQKFLAVSAARPPFSWALISAGVILHLETKAILWNPESSAMDYVLKGNLRSLGGNGFIRRARRAASAVLLSLLLAITAAAYTVVLKSGRRKEIPSNFVVTDRTLTYEAAPGLNVTLLI